MTKFGTVRIRSSPVPATAGDPGSTPGEPISETGLKPPCRASSLRPVTLRRSSSSLIISARRTCFARTVSFSRSLIWEASVRISLSPVHCRARVVLRTQVGELVLTPQDRADLHQVESEQLLELSDPQQSRDVVRGVPTRASCRVTGRHEELQLLVIPKRPARHPSALGGLSYPQKADRRRPGASFCLHRHCHDPNFASRTPASSRSSTSGTSVTSRCAPRVSRPPACYRRSRTQRPGDREGDHKTKVERVRR